MNIKEMIMNTPDFTDDYDAADIADHKGTALISYIGPLCFVSAFAVKGSPFTRFHANQGIVYLIAGVIAGIVAAILGKIPYVGWLLALPVNAANIGLAVLGIINAAKGKAKELPFIGYFKILK